MSKEGVASYFQWLKSEYGFSESKVKPYTFNSQPFIVNKQSAMQGYVTSEPYAVEKAAGFKPGVVLLADHGFNAYSTLIETRTRDRRQEARPGAALRRCFRDRLVQLSLRRQRAGKRDDQT